MSSNNPTRSVIKPGNARSTPPLKFNTVSTNAGPGASPRAIVFFTFCTEFIPLFFTI